MVIYMILDMEENKYLKVLDKNIRSFADTGSFGSIWNSLEDAENYIKKCAETNNKQQFSLSPSFAVFHH